MQLFFTIFDKISSVLKWYDQIFQVKRSLDDFFYLFERRFMQEPPDKPFSLDFM